MKFDVFLCILIGILFFSMGTGFYMAAVLYSNPFIRLFCLTGMVMCTVTVMYIYGLIKSWDKVIE